MPDTSLSQHQFHVLLAVADRALHGTAIMEDVLDRTDGRLRLWPGTLYGTLHALSERRLVREVDPPPDAPTDRGKRRFYEITPAGRRLLADEVRLLAGIVRDAKAKRVIERAEPV